MHQKFPDRVGLWCPDLVGRRVEIRNRRPGDHLHPLGSNRNRRLKDMLIDSCIPSEERDAIPLLVIDGKIAWVPGLTLSESFRLPADAHSVWIATLESPDIHGSPERFVTTQATTREKGTDS
jgi:tRNA(Ile)-lysidine synthetase-like protein